MMNPAGHVIEKVGGVDAAARLSERSKNRVYRWGRPRESGGCDGLIPAEIQRRMLINARVAGVDLQPIDFTVGLLPSEDAA